MLYRKQELFKDSEGKYYFERNKTNEDGSNSKEYVETTLLTHQINEANILTSKDGLTTFSKTGEIHRLAGTEYVKSNR